MAPDGCTGVLYSPYHLCGIETPLTIAEAALFKHATAAPSGHPVADVVAVAKRDLSSGQQLDGSGGSTLNGYIVEWSEARELGLLPLALAEAIKLRQPIRKGSPLRYDDVSLPDYSALIDLRRQLGDVGREIHPGDTRPFEIRFPA